MGESKPVRQTSLTWVNVGQTSHRDKEGCLLTRPPLLLVGCGAQRGAYVLWT